MSAAILGREHWIAALTRRWDRAWGEPDDATPVIYVRQCGGPGWWVVVEPASGIASERFPGRDAALREAGTIQRATGWEIAAGEVTA